MQIDDRVLELLLEWEDAGGDLSDRYLEQLAEGDAVLAADLKKYAARLHDMDWLEVVEQDPVTSAVDIEIIKSAALVPEEMSLDAFKKRLNKANVIDSDTLLQFIENDQSTSSAGLCRNLLKAELLTPFQLRAITHGKTRGLRMDRYIILDRIGKGGMGQVFKAKHAKMKRVVALKVLPRAAMKNQNAVARFFRESEAAARLNHPNIVTAFDAGESEGLHYLVMEYVEGKDLDLVIRRRGPLRVATAIDYLKQAAQGLGYAHEDGLIHRDIKPANMLLDEHGVVKILDMGIARIVREAEAEQEDKEITHEGAVIGTIDYMAPEQAVNSKAVDKTVDLYALGCTLHYLLTGRPPFDEGMLMVRMLAHREKRPPNLCEVRKDVPPSLNDIFQKLMAKSPGERYARAEELIAALEAVQSDVERLESEVGEQSSLTVPEEDLDTSRTNFIETIRTFDFGPLVGSRDSTGTSSPEAARRRRPLIYAATALAVVTMAVLAGYLLTSRTSAGTVMFESDRAAFEASIQGKRIRLQNTQTDDWTDVTLADASQAVTLPPGTYRLGFGVDSGLVADIRQFEITPGGQSEIVLRWNADADLAHGDLQSRGRPLSPSEVLTASSWVWGEPKNLGPKVNTPADDYSPVISPDGLELIAPSRREGGQGDYDLWSFKRSARDQPWGEGAPIAQVNSSHADSCPSLANDGRMLLYVTRRNGKNELYSSSRKTTADPWGNPRKLPVNFSTRFNYSGCCLSPDLRELVFTVIGPSNPGLWVSKRPKVSDPFPEPRRIGWSDNEHALLHPHMTADGKALLFQVDATYEKDLWITQRDDTGAAWSKPRRLFDSQIGCQASGPSLTADGRELYFVGREMGRYRADIYCVKRLPQTSITQASASPFKTRKVLMGSARTQILKQHSPEEMWTFDPKQDQVATVNLKTGQGKALLTLESPEEIQQVVGLPEAGLLAVVRQSQIDLVDPQSTETVRSLSLPECKQARAGGSWDGSKIFGTMLLEDGKKRHAAWQIDSGDQLWMTSEEAEELNLQSNSPTGDLIVLGNDSGRISVRDTQSGRVRFETNIPVKRRGYLAPDQKFVFTNDYDEIVVRDLASGRDTALPLTHPGYFYVKFSPDHRKLLAYGRRMFQVLDWESKNRIAQSGKLRHRIDRLDWDRDSQSIHETTDNWITHWRWDYSGDGSSNYEVVTPVPYNLDRFADHQWTVHPLTEENVATPSYLEITQGEIRYQEAPREKSTHRHSNLTNLPSENVIVSMKVLTQPEVEAGLLVKDPGVRNVSIDRKKHHGGSMQVGEYYDAGEKWQWRGLSHTPYSEERFAELAILTRENVVALYCDGELVTTTTGIPQASWQLRFHQLVNEEQSEATIKDIRFTSIPAKPNDSYHTFQQDPPWQDYFEQAGEAPTTPAETPTELASSDPADNNSADSSKPAAMENTAQQGPVDGPLTAPFNEQTAQAAQKAWADKLGVEVEFTNSIGMKFRLIPPGTFTRDVQGKDYEVEITRPYYMGVHEVTREQFLAMLPNFDDELSDYGNGAMEPLLAESRGIPTQVPKGDPSRLPIFNVSWTECQLFLKKLNQSDPNHRFRLPSEAEWEYACRAGTKTRYSVGDKITTQDAHFNFASRITYSKTRPIEVGRFPANPFGLHDMHGNVCEWCYDWFERGYFTYALKKDPIGPVGGEARVYRGGSFRDSSEYDLQSSRRDAAMPEYPQFDVGFRAVCEIDQASQLAATQPTPSPAKSAAAAMSSSAAGANGSSPLPSSGLVFDGKDDFVELPQLPLSKKDQITIEAWVTPLSDYPLAKEDLLPEATVFGWSPNQGLRLAAFHESFGAYVESSRFDGSVGDDNPFTRLINIKYPLPLYEPTHVALCFDRGRQVSFFENGRKFASTTLRTPPLGLDQQPLIGASRGADRNPQNFFRGIVHQLRISKGILYDGFFKPDWDLTSDATTVGLYHFEAGQGNMVHDKSGNGFDGKIEGAQWDASYDCPRLPPQQWTHLIEEDAIRRPHHLINKEEFLFVTEQGQLTIHPQKSPQLRPHVMIPVNCGPCVFRLNLAARDIEPDVQVVFRTKDEPKSINMELARRSSSLVRRATHFVVWGFWDGERLITGGREKRIAYNDRRTGTSEARLHALVLHGGVASSEWGNLAVYPLSEDQASELKKSRSRLNFGDIVSTIGDATDLSRENP